MPRSPQGGTSEPAFLSLFPIVIFKKMSVYFLFTDLIPDSFLSRAFSSEFHRILSPKRNFEKTKTNQLLIF